MAFPRNVESHTSRGIGPEARQKAGNSRRAITGMLPSLNRSFMCAGRQPSLVKMSQHENGDMVRVAI